MIGYRQGVGSLNDRVKIPYEANKNSLYAHLNTSYYHIHGESWIYPDKANPILLTSSEASWSETGDIIEIIPANVLTHPFDLHWCSVWDVSNSLYGVVDIFAGLAGNVVKIGAIDVGRTANFSRESAMPVQIPQQPANTRISCRFSDSTTSPQTLRVKFYGHYYGL
jgi:hypothetical protein